MRKLLALIFLSFSLGLLTACGERQQSGPDPLVLEREMSSSESQKRAGSTWPDAKLKILSILDIENEKELTRADERNLSAIHFFNQYKPQYKNEAISADIFESENVWFFNAQGAGPKHLVKIKVGNWKELNSMTLKFFNFHSPNEFTTARFVSYDLQRQQLEFEIDLSKFKRPISVLGVAIENFEYIRSGKTLSYLQEQESVLRNAYRLVVENTKSGSSFYISDQLSLRQALSELQIDHAADEFGNIAQIFGLHDFSEDVDINLYEDHAGFWKLVNTPSQSLNFTPMAGETILIKYVTMKDLRERVAERKIVELSSFSPLLEPRYNPEAFKWKIKNIEVEVFEPYVATHLMKGKREERREREGPRGGGFYYAKVKCHYYRKSVAYRPKKTESLRQIVLHSPRPKIDLGMAYASRTLSVGLQNKTCGKRHGYRFGLGPQEFPLKYKIKAQLEEYMKL